MIAPRGGPGLPWRSSRRCLRLASVAAARLPVAAALARFGLRAAQPPPVPLRPPAWLSPTQPPPPPLRRPRRRSARRRPPERGEHAALGARGGPGQGRTPADRRERKRCCEQSVSHTLSPNFKAGRDRRRDAARARRARVGVAREERAARAAAARRASRGAPWPAARAGPDGGAPPRTPRVVRCAAAAARAARRAWELGRPAARERVEAHNTGASRRGPPSCATAPPSSESVPRSWCVSKNWPSLYATAGTARRCRPAARTARPMARTSAFALAQRHDAVPGVEHRVAVVAVGVRRDEAPPPPRARWRAHDASAYSALATGQGVVDHDTRVGVPLSVRHAVGRRAMLVLEEEPAEARGPTRLVDDAATSASRADARRRPWRPGGGSGAGSRVPLSGSWSSSIGATGGRRTRRALDLDGPAATKQGSL